MKLLEEPCQGLSGAEPCGATPTVVVKAGRKCARHVPSWLPFPTGLTVSPRPRPVSARPRLGCWVPECERGDHGAGSHGPALPEPRGMYCAPARCYCGDCPAYRVDTAYATQTEGWKAVDAPAIRSGKRRGDWAAARGELPPVPEVVPECAYCLARCGHEEECGGELDEHPQGWLEEPASWAAA